MFCPRCGTQNEEGDRFCVSCGASLREPTPRPGESRSLRERIQALIGTTPRARALTAGTAIAIVAAIVAFIAIPADEDEPTDPFTVSADQLCVDSKQQIIAAARQFPLTAGPGPYASALVPILARWRLKLVNTPGSEDDVEGAQRLNLALREMEIKTGTIARVSEEGPASELAPLSRQADQAAAGVEEAIDDLELPDCRDLAVGLVRQLQSGE